MHPVAPKAETELLRAVLEEGAALSPKEREAFTSMQRRGRPLTEKQRAWLSRVAASMGVGVEEEAREHDASTVYPTRPRARSERRPLVIP
jgi:hypothetical protein